MKKCLALEERRRLKELFEQLFDTQTAFLEQILHHQEDYEPNKEKRWHRSTLKNVWVHLASDEGPGQVTTPGKLKLLISFLVNVEPRDHEARESALEILRRLDDLSDLKEKRLHLRYCDKNGRVSPPTRIFTIRSGDMIGRAVEGGVGSSTWRGAEGVKAIAPVAAGDLFHRKFASFWNSDVGWTVTYLEGKKLGLAVNEVRVEAGHTVPIKHNDILTLARDWHYLVQDDDRLDKIYPSLVW